jgi:hypothetical protein
LELNGRARSVEADNMPQVAKYWHAHTVRVRSALVDPLELWRRVVRIHSPLVALAALLGLAGVALAPNRRERAALALLVVFAGLLFVVPVATSLFDVRYALPGGVLIVAAAARGGELVAGRVRGARAN